MAASFWESTQRRFWMFSKDGLESIRDKQRADEQALYQTFPLPEWRHLSIYFNQREPRRPPIPGATRTLTSLCRGESAGQATRA